MTDETREDRTRAARRAKRQRRRGREKVARVAARLRKEPPNALRQAAQALSAHTFECRACRAALRRDPDSAPPCPDGAAVYNAWAAVMDAWVPPVPSFIRSLGEPSAS